LQRYFIQLSYNGFAFVGWQKQPCGVTVQGELEKALTTLLRTNVEVVGAGRTDTGVHASYYIAHFDLPLAIDHPDNVVFHLNRILPYEIAVQKIFPVPANKHARFDAVLRTYKYVITTEKNPFAKTLQWHTHFLLDIEKMNQAASLLTKHEDYTSFCKLHGNNITNICHVKEAFWTKINNEIIFTISADRFLRNMVRAIVGTLVDVGRGKIEVADFEKIILTKNRNAASASAPAHGLYLVNIQYDFF